MTIWQAHLDPQTPKGATNPTIEAPNAVGYYTFVCDDGRTIPSVRVPFDARDDGTNGRPLQPDKFLTEQCAALVATDQRVAEISIALAARNLKAGPVALLDLTKQAAVQAADTALQQALMLAAEQKQIADATAIDPTIPAKVAAIQAARDDLTSGL